MLNVVKFKANGLFLLLILLTFLNPSLASAKNKPWIVLDECKCQFPAEFGAYKYFEIIKVRHTIFNEIPGTPLMVKEISAERKGQTYRILVVVRSSITSTVGKTGVLIEIAKLNIPYFYGYVLFQLTPDQIMDEYLKLANG